MLQMDPVRLPVAAFGLQALSSRQATVHGHQRFARCPDSGLIYNMQALVPRIRGYLQDSVPATI